jgi:uncharacterized protein YlxW (UPF0749 family)
MSKKTNAAKAPDPEPVEKKKRAKRVMTAEGMAVLIKISVAASTARDTIIKAVGDDNKLGDALRNSSVIGHTEAFGKMEAAKNALQSIVDEIVERKKSFDASEKKRFKKEKAAEAKLAAEIKETEAKLAALKGESAPAAEDKESQGNDGVG